MDKRALHEVAAKARRWIYRFAERESGRILGSKPHVDTAGFCAIGAAKLYELFVEDERFKGCEINPTVVDCCEGSHAFVVVSTDNDDLIVDVTADQFDMKPIEIRSAHDDDNPWFWGNEQDSSEKDDDPGMEVFSGVKAFKKAVKDWGDQSPQQHGLLQKRARK